MKSGMARQIKLEGIYSKDFEDFGRRGRGGGGIREEEGPVQQERFINPIINWVNSYQRMLVTSFRL